MLLKDRISIVTGGSSGVGRGIALEFAREGARVAIADKQEAPLRGKYHERMSPRRPLKRSKNSEDGRYSSRPMSPMNLRSSG